MTNRDLLGNVRRSTTLITTDTVVNNLIASIFNDTLVNITSFNDVLVKIPWMELNYATLQGSDKKTLVILTVNAVLAKVISDPTELAAAQQLATSVLPMMIDEIVSIANSKTFQKVKSCFSCK